jgi:hypothetical protein
MFGGGSIKRTSFFSFLNYIKLCCFVSLFKHTWFFLFFKESMRNPVVIPAPVALLARGRSVGAPRDRPGMISTIVMKTMVSTQTLYQWLINMLCIYMLYIYVIYIYVIYIYVIYICMLYIYIYISYDIIDPTVHSPR